MDINEIKHLMTSHAENPLDAVFVVSFPKAGRTWVRVLLSRYKQHLLNIEDFYLKLHAVYTLEPVRIPQYVFYHAHSDEVYSPSFFQKVFSKQKQGFDFNLDFCKGSRIIFLMRDPRDTIVSFYHQLNKRQKAYKGSLQTFIRDENYGIQRLISFMNFIVLEKENFNHIFIYYEDLHRDTAAVMQEMLNFAEIPVEQNDIQESIEFASFQNMKKMEESGSYGDKLSAAKAENPDTYKVRKGKIGSYQDELSAEDIQYLDDYIQQHLNNFYSRYKKLPVKQN